MAVRLSFGDAARQQLIAGLTKAARAVLTTFGPAGRWAMLDRPGHVTITRDGVTVLEDIEFSHSEHDIAVELMREACRRTNDQVGDGTTATVLFCTEAVIRMNRLIVAGLDPILITKAQQRYEDLIYEWLDDYVEDVTTKEEIWGLAYLSSSGHEEITNLLAEVFTNIGEDGTVVIEEDMVYGKCRVQYDEGMTIARGYASPSFANQDEVWEAENVRVLCTTDPMHSYAQFGSILEEIAREQVPFLVIAPDIGENALRVLTENNSKGTIKVCAVKGPMYAERQTACIQDIAALCGAEVLGLKGGYIATHCAEFNEHLGTFGKVIVRRDTTILLEGGCSTAQYEERYNHLKDLLESTSDDYALDRIRDRLAHFVGAIARIKVGAPTDIERNELKGRVEDAVYACQAGIRSGIIPGGGSVLYQLGERLRKLSSAPGLDTDVRLLMADLIQCPIRLIAKNACFPWPEVQEAMDNNPKAGLDAKKMEISQDLRADGIIEPIEVVVAAMRNGLSAARMLALSECIIVKLPPNDGLTADQRADQYFKSNWNRHGRGNYISY